MKNVHQIVAQSTGPEFKQQKECHKAEGVLNLFGFGDLTFFSGITFLFLGCGFGLFTAGTFFGKQLQIKLKKLFPVNHIIPLKDSRLNQVRSSAALAVTTFGPDISWVPPHRIDSTIAVIMILISLKMNSDALGIVPIVRNSIPRPTMILI